MAAIVTTPPTVALLGNPNCGKSSVFNQLTGLQQRIGNFPGVTVDKRYGPVRLPDGERIRLVDYPGTYSLYPTSQDERIVVQAFTGPARPDAVLYIADVTQLEKHLLLFTQVRDLGLPVLLVLNMADLAERENLVVDTERLKRQFGVPVVSISGRTGAGLDLLREGLQNLVVASHDFRQLPPYYTPAETEAAAIAVVREAVPDLPTDYAALLVAHHHAWLPQLSAAQRMGIGQQLASLRFNPLKFQVRETMQRFDRFTPVVQRSLTVADGPRSTLTERLDDVLTHQVFGPAIFFLLMLLVFQAIFTWAGAPMDLIDAGFAGSADWLHTHLPDTWWRSLLADGIVAGLGGILIFIPQIAILFFLIAILEEVGYMARAVYLFDHLMQRFGLNGRSIVALVSGSACAIPAVMSTRTIGNWKERLITILVTPFISCSARIPVYTVLIGFVVPATVAFGFFTYQSLAFMGLYLLGITAALLGAWVLKKVLRNDEQSFLLLELPEYRMPVWRNVFLTVYEKVKTFTLEAGKIILIISIILWVLSSYGPGREMATAEAQARTEATELALTEPTEIDNLIAARRIEASYAGHLGKWIEPAIRPLGFDWKIGIALITSFAAREVFVGTMATIYSIGSDSDETSVRARMALERDRVTGRPVYTPATAASLLLFYVFAMQCMSTLAVVRRETKSWKWPLLQFVAMTGLAYLSSWVVYQWWG